MQSCPSPTATEKIGYSVKGLWVINKNISWRTGKFTLASSKTDTIKKNQN